MLRARFSYSTKWPRTLSHMDRIDSAESDTLHHEDDALALFSEDDVGHDSAARGIVDAQPSSSFASDTSTLLASTESHIFQLNTMEVQADDGRAYLPRRNVKVSLTGVEVWVFDFSPFRDDAISLPASNHNATPGGRFSSIASPKRPGMRHKPKL